MARSRNIKPGFFVNEQLVALPYEYRLLFAGLWTLADREGYLEDRPIQTKMKLFPADNVDVEHGLKALGESGLIQQYTADGKRYIHIVEFLKHQNPHHKEPPSKIPKPRANPGLSVDVQVPKPGTSPAVHDEKAPDKPETGCGLNGHARGANPADPFNLIPDSLIPEEKHSSGKKPEPLGFAEVWAAFPKRLGGNPRHDAAKAYRARLIEKHTPEEILAGTKRYAAFVRSTGSEGTQYVKQAAVFLGPSKHFLEPWDQQGPRPSDGYVTQ